MLQLSTF